MKSKAGRVLDIDANKMTNTSEEAWMSSSAATVLPFPPSPTHTSHIPLSSSTTGRRKRTRRIKAKDIEESRPDSGEQVLQPTPPSAATRARPSYFFASQAKRGTYVSKGESISYCYDIDRTAEKLSRDSSEGRRISRIRRSTYVISPAFAVSWEEDE